MLWLQSPFLLICSQFFSNLRLLLVFYSSAQFQFIIFVNQIMLLGAVSERNRRDDRLREKGRRLKTSVLCPVYFMLSIPSAKLESQSPNRMEKWRVEGSQGVLALGGPGFFIGVLHP